MGGLKLPDHQVEQTAVVKGEICRPGVTPADVEAGDQGGDDDERVGEPAELPDTLLISL